MKKIILPFLLLFLTFQSSAQTSGFQEKWEKIDSLEVLGLVESADALVLEVMDAAQKKNAYQDFLKAKIYHYKLYQINQENSTQYILDDLNQTISAMPVPFKNVLLSYKSEFLFQYYKDKRWQIRNRTEIDNPDAGDIQTWSEATLQDSIRTNYERSLQNANQLIKIPTEEIGALLIANPLNRKYKPTLFDLLAHRALEYFADSGMFASVAAQHQYKLISEGLYAPTPQFVLLKFPETATETSEIRALEIYQKLEALHTEDNDPEAKVFAQLQRLDYVNNRFEGSDKWELYSEALRELTEKYRDTEAHALILYQKALNLHERSTETNEDGKLLHPDFLQQAVAILESITKEYPNSDSAQRALRLIGSIKAVEINAIIPEFLSPEKAGRMFLSYKSLDSVELRIAKVDPNLIRDLDYNLRDSIIASLAMKNPVITEKIALPQSEDFNRHSTEILLPALKNGNYLVYISGKDAFEGSGYSYGILQVSNIVLSQTNFEDYNLYRALHRSTGTLLENVKIEFFNRDNRVAHRVFTNELGEVKFQKKPNNSLSNRVRATVNGDTINTNYWNGSYYRQNETQKTTAKSMIYLDRAIYRPGQKVYFKGVLLERANGKTTAVPNEFIEVYVEDPNGEEVAEFRLKTNKYGSFNGEFVLPTSGINGQFRIFTEEDAEAKTPFWNRILEDKGNYYSNGISFSVEEYKRPTFEVEFDSIRQSFKLEETVFLTGKANSFMGAPLSNMWVKYEVQRQKLIKHWWYHRYSEPVTIWRDSVLTDAQGNFTIKFPAMAENEDLKDRNLIYQYNIHATVTDVTGETRGATTNLKLGNKNLLVELQMAENVKPGETLNPKITATNLNNIPVPVKGQLRIYKLKGPDRILGERLWEAPEINIVPEEKFKELFPEEPYTSALEPEQWPKAELVYESTFTTDATYEVGIPVAKEWISGKYLIEVFVNSGENEATTEKAFDVVNLQDKYLPDHQRFNASLQNTEFRKDGKVELLLQTGYKDLHLHIAAYDNNERIFQEYIKLDGRKLLEIPLKNVISEAIQIQVTGVKNNSEIREIVQVDLPYEQRFLRITTESFRNKIQPGMDETWSFKITDENNGIPDAELLASMYDASLDQFITQQWDTEPGFGSPRTNFPSFHISNIGQVTHLINRFPNKRGFRQQDRIFDQLNLFGLYFGHPNSYQYRVYLNSKKRIGESSSLKGNTKGRVTDWQGLSIPGVSVKIKGTSKGTTTNFDGEFGLDTKPGDVLVISFIGYLPVEYKIGKEKEIYVTLEADHDNLEEVVVVGYGGQEKRAMAGAVMDEAEENAQMLLQGKVAGITVAQQDNGSMISIKGTSSVGDGTPLYIVDGTPVSEYNLSSEDILNVQILKGAEATALYGSKAANGVIIITTKKSLADLQNVEARKNFDETAFFFPNLGLDEDGKLQFSFTSPEALTQWKLRLLAHTKDWSTGKYENTVVTQKDLNITPNAPRFLREGDNLVFKAKVTNLSNETMAGTAILELFDGVSMQPIDTLLGNLDSMKTFNLTSSNSEAVSWNLNIPEGVQAVTYRILAKAADFTDGEENLLPVLSNRMLVTESMPFFVRAGETESYELQNLKGNDSETLEHHKFTLEYSSNPAWYAIQSLPYLMEYEHECSEQIFARLYANSLSAHILNSQPKIREVFEAWKNDGPLTSALEKNEELKSLILAETPWLRDAVSETEKKQCLAELFDQTKLANQQKENLKRLGRIQHSSGAFPWFPGGRENYFITRHVVVGFGHLEQLGVELEAKEILQKAIGYLDQQLLENEERARNRSDEMEYFYKGISNLHYLYARSFHLEEFPLPDEVKRITALIVEAQKENWIENTLYNKGLLTLVLSRFGEPEIAANILAALQESAVKSEDYGMYWKENEASWYWYQAPVETQALLIEAFSELENQSEAIEEMKIWLLQNKRTNHWPTTKATTEATYALLMQGNDWLEVDDQTVLYFAGKPIKEEKLAETRKEAGTGYVKLNWKGSEINNTFSEVKIENNNSTAGYGGAYWQYFEDLDKIKYFSESPLNVEKELYLNVPGNSGSSLKQITPETPLKLGDLVTVRLVVRSSADMEFIHLKDMRASGFEPTNVLSQYKYQDGTAYYESTRDAATHFFFDMLRKGTYVLEYSVRANNSGNFSNGITEIESMYAPEFSGHTKGIRVEIGK